MIYCVLHKKNFLIFFCNILIFKIKTNTALIYDVNLKYPNRIITIEFLNRVIKMRLSAHSPA